MSERDRDSKFHDKNRSSRRSPDRRDSRDTRRHAGHEGRKDRERSRSREPKRSRSRSPASERGAEEEKKRLRLAKLAAWKQAQNGEVKVETELKTSKTPVESSATAEAESWVPWEDPTAIFTAPSKPAMPPPYFKLPDVAAPELEVAGEDDDDDVDPLDAFMDSEVNPEVKAKEAEEAKKKEEERRERAKLLSEGKIPKLDKILEEEDEEEEVPDQEIQIPEHKVKLVVGPGGEKIKYIQRKSKCRLQIKKSEVEMNKGFLEKTSYALPKPRKPGDEVKMVTMMLFGNSKECDIANRMIQEAIDNKEQKQKQREKEYERKRDQKSRDRQMYHLRHTHDYETLGIPIGASKAEARQAYRQLAKKWHPDKHPDNAEEMKVKFQAIQKAFDSLMSTDEDARIESLAHT